MASSAPTPVILDVDTGIDDAFALLLAARHPALNLLGVTCVAGNAPLDDVVRNTLTVLETAGRTDVPVVAGATRPLLAEPDYALHVMGGDGFGDVDWPRSTRAPHAGHAVAWLHDTLMAAPEPVTLVTLAPMANIALLLRMHPQVASQIARIVVMGGSAGTGNATPLAEFNVFHDPEAAAIVFGSSIPITMYGLDVFDQVLLPVAHFEQLAASASPVAQLAGRLGIAFARTIGDPVCLGDAGAVAILLEPQALTTQELLVSVITHDGPARGMTQVDRRSNTSVGNVPPKGRLVDVGLQVDADALARVWWESVSA